MKILKLILHFIYLNEVIINDFKCVNQKPKKDDEIDINNIFCKISN